MHRIPSFDEFKSMKLGLAPAALLLDCLYGPDVPLKAAQGHIPKADVDAFLDRLYAAEPVAEFIGHDGRIYTCESALHRITVAQYEDICQVMHRIEDELDRIIQLTAILYIPKGLPYSQAIEEHDARVRMLRSMPITLHFGAVSFIAGVATILPQPTPMSSAAARGKAAAAEWLAHSLISSLRR